MERFSFFDKTANFYIIVLIIGFLFIGIVPRIIGLSEDSLSLPFRIIILCASIFVIFKIFFSPRLSKIYLSPIILFLVFWAIYSVRIIHDLYLNPIKLFPETNSSEYFQFAFGVVLIPSISLFLILQAYKLNIEWTLKWLYRFLFLILSIALFSRAGSEVTGRTAGDITVGIISFGQFSATLSILSIYYLASVKLNYINIIYYTLGFLIGFSGIIVSASKSPLLALILVLFIFFVLRFQFYKSIILISLLGIFSSLYFVELITFFSQYFNSNILERILYSIEIGDDTARKKLISVAFNDFLDNPFFGNAMLIQKNGMAGTYPHNLIIESFMATGIIGGSIFILWLIKCLKASVKVIKVHSEISWIALLFLQYLIFGMFSKNLYANDLFWMSSLLLIGIHQVNIKNSNKSKIIFQANEKST